MGVVSRVGAGEFPVILSTYPWLLDIDKVKVILKCKLECYQVGRVYICHIRLEDRDRLVPHRCCEGVVLGQLTSAVLVCWVAAFLGR